MTSTTVPTNINVQSPVLGSRFETGFPGCYDMFGKQILGRHLLDQFGPIGTYQGPHPGFQGPFGFYGHQGQQWTHPHQQFYGGWPEQHHHYQQQYQQHFGGNYQHHIFCNLPFRPTTHLEYHCLTNPVRILDHEGNRCIWLCFDMCGFKPEECNVTFNKTERCIIVECNQESKDGKEHHVQRKYYRKYCFPETFKCDFSKCEPRCYFNQQDGQLTIECQLPKMTPEEMTRCPQFTCYPGYQQSSPYSYTPVNCKLC